VNNDTEKVVEHFFHVKYVEEDEEVGDVKNDSENGNDVMGKNDT